MAEPADLNLDELKRRGRRRLIGAVVLALVAAVVVPMLLESDPKPLGEDVSVRIPPVDDGKFVNKLGEPRAKGGAPELPRKSLADAEKSILAPGGRPAAPVESRPAPTTTPTTAPAPSPAPAASAPPPVPAATPPAPPAAAPKAAAQAPAPKAEPAPAPAAKADAPKDGGFVVQLAAFTDDKGANALAGKLKRAGFPSYTETVTTSRGTLWRVRVGPYPSREAAGQSRDRLKGEGHAGIVVPAK